MSGIASYTGNSHGGPSLFIANVYRCSGSPYFSPQTRSKDCRVEVELGIKEELGLQTCHIDIDIEE